MLKDPDGSNTCAASSVALIVSLNLVSTNVPEEQILTCLFTHFPENPNQLL